MRDIRSVKDNYHSLDQIQGHFAVLPAQFMIWAISSSTNVLDFWGDERSNISSILYGAIQKISSDL